VPAAHFVVVYTLYILLFIFAPLRRFGELGGGARVLQRPSAPQLLVGHGETMLHVILLHTEWRPMVEWSMICKRGIDIQFMSTIVAILIGATSLLALIISIVRRIEVRRQPCSLTIALFSRLG
jgi:hypothetical protein